MLLNRIACDLCWFLISHFPDVEAFKEGVHVVTGTPGRVLDLASRGILDTSAVKTLILDEADEMLSLGFKDQIYDIFQLLPAKMQVGLFSATMSAEVCFLFDELTVLYCLILQSRFD